MFGPLQDNGGPTTPGGVVLTHALLPGSPAIDQIPIGVNSCQANFSLDQRGYVRASGVGQGGIACDIGAFEFDDYGPISGDYKIYLPVVLKP